MNHSRKITSLALPALEIGHKLSPNSCTIFNFPSRSQKNKRTEIPRNRFKSCKKSRKGNNLYPLQFNKLIGGSSKKSRNMKSFKKKGKRPRNKVKRTRERLKVINSRSYDYSQKSRLSVLINEPSQPSEKNRGKIRKKSIFEHNFSISGKFNDSKMFQANKKLIGTIKEKNRNFMKMRLSELTKSRHDETDSSSMAQSDQRSKEFFLKRKRVRKNYLKRKSKFIKSQSKERRNIKNFKSLKINLDDEEERKKMKIFYSLKKNSDDENGRNLFQEKNSKRFSKMMDKSHLEDDKKSRMSPKKNPLFSIGKTSKMNLNYRVLPSMVEKIDKNKMNTYTKKRKRSSDNFTHFMKNLKKSPEKIQNSVQESRPEERNRREINPDFDSETVIMVKMFELLKEDNNNIEYLDFFMKSTCEQDLIPKSKKKK